MGIKTLNFSMLKPHKEGGEIMFRELKDRDGNWVEEIEDIAGVVTNYFDSLFNAGTCSQMEECLDTVMSKVTPDMQQMLSSEFTADEIKTAVFQMGPTKAPGLNGMNAIFYQKFWHVMGDSVIVAVMDYLHMGFMAPDINHTNSVLIPKVKQPKKMFDFRPISLCNVIYKIISKVLGNRLKQILPSVISTTQSAFLPGRLITDNVFGGI